MAKDGPTDPAKKPTKAEFVLSVPADMPAAEVVKKAEEAGLKISPAHVHTIRSQAKRSAAAETAKAAEGPAAEPAPKRASPKTKTAKKSAKAPKAKPAAKKRAKAVPKAKKPAKAPRAKVAPKAGRKGTRTSKADIVRSMPLTLPVKDVIEAAKKHGVTLSDTYVYMVRAELKKNAPRKTAAAEPVKSEAGVQVATTAMPKPMPKTPSPEEPTREMVFVRLALDMGLQRARDLLAAVDEKLAGLVASIK